jgi:hypothetical protein
MRLGRDSTSLRKIGREAECEGFAGFGFEVAACFLEDHLLPKPERFSSLTLHISRESHCEEKGAPGCCSFARAAFDPGAKGAEYPRPNPYDTR